MISVVEYARPRGHDPRTGTPSIGSARRWLLLIAVTGTLATLGVLIGLIGPGSLPAEPAEPDSGPAAAVCGYENRVPGNPLLAGGHAPGGVVAVVPAGTITAIDRPRFESAARAGRWLGPDAPVVVVRVGRDVRAYPSAILLWHEVVNDVVGGRPLVISFCPLCNTAVVYERTLAGKAHLFEVSGELLLGAAVLRDRSFGTTYAQPTGKRIGGSSALGPLRWYPSDLMTLDQAAAANPGLRVLSRDTGHTRDYGTTPYPRIDRPRSVPSLFDGYVDARLRPKTRLVGAVLDGVPRAWRYEALQDARVHNDSVGGHPVVVVFRPTTTSIGAGTDLADAPAVGSAGVFDPRVGSRVLRFDAAGEDAITDRETGSVWDLTGLARSGPLAGTRLEVLSHLDTYWYVWAARHPDTGVWPPLRPGECSLRAVTP